MTIYTILYPPFSRHSLFASGVAHRHKEQEWARCCFYSMQKQQKPTPSCPTEKIGFQSHVFSLPTLAIGCDESDDDEV
jgi:hypothetical protein